MSCKIYLDILNTKPLLAISFAEIFFHSVGCLCSFFYLLLFNYSCPNFPSFPPLLSPASSCSLSQSPPCCPLPWVLYTCSLTRFFPFFSLSPLPSGHCQFVPYFHVSSYILLTCLFYWLGSNYRWDHMVFVFHCLAYFTKHNAFQIHQCCCEG